MTFLRFWPTLFILAIFIGLAFRLPALEKRPMHGDEAIHAIKFGTLLEEGTYRYDPSDFHGPTLNYLTLVPAWFGAKHKLADVNESTLRIVPVFFGILLIIMLLPLVDGLGWPVIVVAAFLTAISPAMVFYSRYYIQEMLLISFAFGAIVCGYRYFCGRKAVWGLAAGVFCGLMHATKETFVMSLAAMFFAVGVMAVLRLSGYLKSHRHCEESSTKQSPGDRQKIASSKTSPKNSPIRHCEERSSPQRASRRLLRRRLLAMTSWCSARKNGARSGPWGTRNDGLVFCPKGWHEGPCYTRNDRVANFRAKHIFAGILSAILVSLLFYSSFFSNPQGILDSILTYGTNLARAGGAKDWHIHPWYFYFQRLLFFQQKGAPFWSEAAIAILAFIGFGCAFSKYQIPQIDKTLLRFLAIYTISMTIVFSLIPYKTPWNLLGFWHGFILLAGVGAIVIFSAIKKNSVKIIVMLLVIGGCAHLIWQSYSINYQYEADPANPYVYAHPTNDVLAMAQRIKNFAQAHPDGRNTYIQFICSNGDYWPFPWYLRDYPNIGWWNKVDEDVPSAPIIIISPDLEVDLARKLYELRPPGNRDLYVPFFEEEWQLRPGLALRGYVTQQLWNKYYQSMEGK